MLIHNVDNTDLLSNDRLWSVVGLGINSENVCHSMVGFNKKECGQNFKQMKSHSTNNAKIYSISNSWIGIW